MGQIKTIIKNKASQKGRYTTYLKGIERSINSTSFNRKVRCDRFWYCKRMSCNRCIRIKRASFIQRGKKYANDNKITHFITLTLKNKKNVIYQDYYKIDAWFVLSIEIPKIAKFMFRHMGKYIRCLGVGKQKEAPHLHALITEHAGKSISKRIKKYKSNFEVTKQIKLIHNLDGILGYIFDQNYLPTYKHSGRLKRQRVMCASRGMKLSFPSYKEIEDLNLDDFNL